MVFTLRSFITKSYFPRSKQVIFILGILVISIITGFFGSFFTSVTQRDYFVNSNEPDVINILEAGYKSPIVSYVPSNYLDVLHSIKGITAISPEVHSLVLINNVPVTLHGITNSFFEINDTKVIAGHSLHYIFSSNRTNIIIAGAEIAQSLKLKVGKTYEIFSSNTNSFGSFYLAGIVKFNTFNDEEIFTTTTASAYFRSQSNTFFYSMIRIKINPSIITTKQINEYLSQKFVLQVNFLSHFQDLSLIRNKEVKIFLSNGVLVGDAQTNQYGSCSFSLPIGLYDIYFYSGNNIVNNSIIFLNSTVKNFYVDNSLSFSTNSNIAYNLSINSFYNDSLVNATTLSLTNPYGNSFYFKNQPTFNFTNLITGSYNIGLTYNNISLSRTILLNSDLNESFNFTKSINFIVKNSTNNTLLSYACSLYNYRTSLTQKYSSCPTQLTLEKSVYNVTFRSPTNKTNSFLLSVNDTTPNSFTIFVGNQTQIFQLQDQNNNSLSNIQVFYRPITSNDFVKGDITNSTGGVSFNYTFGTKYYLLFSNGFSNASVFFDPTQLEPLIILKPFQNFILNATFFNGNDITKNASNVNVTIATVNGQMYNLTTNNLGQIHFNSSVEFIGNISIVYKNELKSFQIDTTFNKNYTFTLGFLDLNLYIRSISNRLIPNVDINIASLNYNIHYTNSNGTIHLLLPSSTNYDPLVENYFFNSFIDLSSLSNDFISQNLFKITVSFNSTETTFYLPRSYQYSDFNYSVKLPYYFKVSFKLRDAFGFNIKNAQIYLSGNYGHFQGLTDGNGQTSINVEPGQYSMVVKYLNYEYEYQINVNQNNVTSLQLPIYVNKINVAFYKPNISALSGQQYLDQFYSSSISYFLQVFTILMIIVIFILVLLFSSVVKLTIESIRYEIFVLNLLGSSKYEMFFTILFNFQMLSLISSTIGLTIGMFLTQFLNVYSRVNIIGFIFYSEFNIFYFIFYLIAVNAIIFIVLVNMLMKMKLIYPIHLLRRN